MPYVPVVGDVAEVSMQGVLASAGGSAVNVANVFHYRLSVIVAPPTKTALETIFNTNVAGTYLAACNARYTQTFTTVRWINDATDGPLAFTRAGSGAIATAVLPSNVAVSMLFRTALRGREFRGAKRFAAPSEADTTGDVLVGAALVLWQALQTELLLTQTDALNNVWQPCVLSRKLSTLATNPTAVFAQDVTQVLLNKNIGTMKGRGIRTVR